MSGHVPCGDGAFAYVTHAAEAEPVEERTDCVVTQTV